jgi:hypothetical protein
LEAASRVVKIHQGSVADIITRINNSCTFPVWSVRDIVHSNLHVFTTAHLIPDARCGCIDVIHWGSNQ